MSVSEAPSTPSQRLGFWVGLVVGLFTIAFANVLPRPEGMSVEAVRLVGVAVIVAVWWVTEAIPLGAAALVPAAAFPILGIATSKKVASAYMSPIILLLLGGFLLALAVERSGVHRRIALHILRLVGTSPRRLVLGFALAAAGLSMWISNTATTLIMMPIALAVAERARSSRPEEASAFSIAVLLGTGYGASIGGMGTPVGTPPNLIAMKALSEKFPDGVEFTFVSWATASLPVVIIVIPLMWLLLTQVYPKVSKDLELGASEVIREELQALGPWRPSELRALLVFGIAAILWITRPDLVLSETIRIPGWMSLIGVKKVHDGSVAVLVAVLAFCLPSGDKPGEKLLPWSTAVKVPWGLVLLFGGGVALSKGFDSTGLSRFLGEKLAVLAEQSESLFLAVSCLAATFGTELISNTALANITMPILADTAKAAGTDPRLLLLPPALACSCAFMMPAATGPNAIVFGTGKIRISQMVKAGFITNWVAWLVIVAMGLWVYR